MGEDLCIINAMGLQPSIKLLDCTLRDGGYLNHWQFDSDLVRAVYRASLKSGIDILEIGFRSQEQAFDRNLYGDWRFSDEHKIRELIPGPPGLKLAVMADFGKVDLHQFGHAKESCVQLVRLAVHRKDLLAGIAFLEKVKAKGYEVSLNVTSCDQLSQADRIELVCVLKSKTLDMVYLADSYGSILPHQIQALVSPYLEIGNIQVGFHAHNNLQMAFANTLEAIRCGVHLIDCTIYGMGRGAGNLPSEIIILYLQLLYPERYQVLPILNCIDAHFLSLKKELKWGYALPFMLSGMFQCHPNYAKELVDFREYSMEEIFKCMEYIKQANTTHFSKDLVKDIMEQGVSELMQKHQKKNSAVLGDRSKPVCKIAKNPDYQNAHEGRDFLILGNGPCLKTHHAQIQAFIHKHDPIVMGANHLSGLFEPHYHAFGYLKRFVKYIDTVSSRSEILLSQYFDPKTISEYTSRPYRELFFKDHLSSNFDIQEGIVQTNCRTISLLLMGVAIVMGARKIFAAGLDGYLQQPPTSLLFYDEKDEKTNAHLIIERHEWCEKFLRQIHAYLIHHQKSGISIITPTSYQDFYDPIEKYISSS